MKYILILLALIILSCDYKLTQEYDDAFERLMDTKDELVQEAQENGMMSYRLAVLEWIVANGVWVDIAHIDSVYEKIKMEF